MNHTDSCVNGSYDCLQSICQELCQDFDRGVNNGDQPIIQVLNSRINLQNNSNNGSINALETKLIIIESITQAVEVLTHDGPTFLDKISVATIWSHLISPCYFQ